MPELDVKRALFHVEDGSFRNVAVVKCPCAHTVSLGYLHASACMRPLQLRKFACAPWACAPVRFSEGIESLRLPRNTERLGFAHMPLDAASAYINGELGWQDSADEQLDA